MPSQAELLAFTALSERAESVQFDVLDASNLTIGQVYPIEPFTFITHDTARTGTRTLEQLRLTPSDTAALDVRTARIRPSWKFLGGTLYPLGVFLFANPQLQRHTWGVESVNNLNDLTVTVDVADPTPPSFAVGSRVQDAIIAYAGTLGIAPLVVDPSANVFGQPTAWPPGTSSYQIFADLAALAGFYAPFFDNAANFHFRAIPNIPAATPDFTYEQGTTVDVDTMNESDDLLVAPNRFIVIGGGIANATPIVGVYDIPAGAPNSIANLGRVISQTITMQAIASVPQAQQAARAAYTQATIGTSVEFDSVCNPLHDTFDVVRFNGRNYLEVAWRLDLIPGGRQHHTLRGVL